MKNLFFLLLGVAVYVVAFVMQCMVLALPVMLGIFLWNLFFS